MKYKFRTSAYSDRKISKGLGGNPPEPVWMNCLLLTGLIVIGYLILSFLLV